MSSKLLNKTIKKVFKGEVSLNFPKIHEMLSFSQENNMKRLVDLGILSKKQTGKGGLVFNCSPVGKDEIDRGDMNFNQKTVALAIFLNNCKNYFFFF